MLRRMGLDMKLKVGRALEDGFLCKGSGAALIIIVTKERIEKISSKLFRLRNIARHLLESHFTKARAARRSAALAKYSTLRPSHRLLHCGWRVQCQ